MLPSTCVKWSQRNFGCHLKLGSHLKKKKKDFLEAMDGISISWVCDVIYSSTVEAFLAGIGRAVGR